LVKGEALTPNDIRGGLGSLRVVQANGRILLYKGGDFGTAKPIARVEFRLYESPQVLAERFVKVARRQHQRDKPGVEKTKRELEQWLAKPL
jgi:hypothetical protein